MAILGEKTKPPTIGGNVDNDSSGDDNKGMALMALITLMVVLAIETGTGNRGKNAVGMR